MKNSEILDSLFERGGIRACRTPLFDSDPPPLPPDFDFSRVEGMMLGLAVGDALGATSEGMSTSGRRAMYGEIRDYLSNFFADERAVGVPTDDTQLAYWTIESLLEESGLAPEKLAQRFAERRIFGIGMTVRGFLGNLKSGRPWYEAGPGSAGNGALMRIAPVLIPHVRNPSRELWADAALCAMMTHNDAASTSTCVAWVSILWQLLSLEEAPAAEWWLNAYLESARDIEGSTSYSPRSPHVGDYRGSLCDFVEHNITEAALKTLSAQEACDTWYSGAYLLETVPSVLYILMRHSSDPEQAIIRAVNDTRDNDTCAAIVGSAVGALHGVDAIPARWRSGLLGRTCDNDDGRVFELLKAARDRWGAPAAPREE